MVAAAIFNSKRGRRGKRFKIKDFIGPPPWEKKEKKPKKKKSRKEQQEELQVIKRKFREL